MNDLEKAYKEEVSKKKGELKAKQDFLIYVAYRELRLSGFVLKKDLSSKGVYKWEQLGCGKRPLIRMKLNGIWKKPFYYTGEKKAINLYRKYWLGQYLSYKRKRGEGMFFDHYEAYYLKEKGSIKEEISRPSYYEYYKEWRDCGYVVKSGFKFGALFRIYEPGTTPENFKHSSYLLKIQDRKRLSGLEFFGLLRVAESVRKKLLVPVELGKEEKEPNFSLYKERYLGFLKIYHESQNINWNTFLKYINYAYNRESPLFVGIVDGDTSLSLFKIGFLFLKNQTYLKIERFK